MDYSRETPSVASFCSSRLAAAPTSRQWRAGGYISQSGFVYIFGWVHEQAARLGSDWLVG